MSKKIRHNADYYLMFHMGFVETVEYICVDNPNAYKEYVAGKHSFSSWTYASLLLKKYESEYCKDKSVIY